MEGSKVLGWLLEERDPSVRYATMRDLMEYDHNDPVLHATREKIPASRMIERIFSKQKAAGHWEHSDSPYLPKYKASYWQVMMLADLGMDRQDPRVRNACRYIFQFQHPEGGFTCNTEHTARREYTWLIHRGKRLPQKNEWIKKHIHEGQLSCLTGNIVAALVRLGYEKDIHVRRALEWLVRVQNNDGGWLCPYWSAHIRDKHGCFYGTIGPLDAFSTLSPGSRTRAIREAIARGAEFLLMHRLYQADHHGYSIINKKWLKQTYPLFINYTILRGLDVLARLGYTRDKRAGDALSLLQQNRLPSGVWILESTPSGRMQTNIEPIGKPSKWLTLIALRVLKRFLAA
jgi:hypothetical protein